MARVFVTGSEGFTGRYLVRRLLDHGHNIFGLTHRADSEIKQRNYTQYNIDVSNQREMQAVLEIVRPEMVVHLAAIAFVGHGNAEEIYHTNIIGTRTLLDLLIKTRAPVTSVLLASSATIYGNNHNGIIKETEPLSPANDYAVSKLAMEYVARLYADQLPIIIARPFNYTGVGQSNNFLIPKIIDHARRRAPQIELGNIDVAREFSDVRTVVEIYHRLINSPSAIGKTLNICSGQAYTLRQVLELVQSLTGHALPVVVNPSLVRTNEVKMLCGAQDKLINIIGTVTAPTLKETLSWMLMAD